MQMLGQEIRKKNQSKSLYTYLLIVVIFVARIHVVLRREEVEIIYTVNTLSFWLHASTPACSRGRHLTAGISGDLGVGPRITFSSAGQLTEETRWQLEDSSRRCTRILWSGGNQSFKISGGSRDYLCVEQSDEGHEESSSDSRPLCWALSSPSSISLSPRVFPLSDVHAQLFQRLMKDLDVVVNGLLFCWKEYTLKELEMFF